MSTPRPNVGQGAERCKMHSKPTEHDFEIDVELVPQVELKPAEAQAATHDDDEVQLAELVEPASHVRQNDTVRLAESAEPTRVNLPEPLVHAPPKRAGVPDWLGDVQPAVKAGNSPANVIPDWIADVADVQGSASSCGGPLASTGWLADIVRLENLRATSQPQTNVDPIPPPQRRAGDDPTPPPPTATDSNTRAFYEARNALAKWVDDDCHRNLILTAELEDLKKHPEIKALLAQFRSYGPLMRDKLLNHLEFLAQNRRKYYAARAK